MRQHGCRFGLVAACSCAPQASIQQFIAPYDCVYVARQTNNLGEDPRNEKCCVGAKVSNKNSDPPGSSPVSYVSMFAHALFVWINVYTETPFIEKFVN